MSYVLAAIKAIPILDKWFQQLVVAYANERRATMDKENRAAIKKALEEDDQRDLETALGSTRSGLPSGIDGSTQVDKLPGVK